MHIPTVLVEAKDHPNGAVLINAYDFVEGVHVLHVEGESQKQEKPKKK